MTRVLLEVSLKKKIKIIYHCAVTNGAVFSLDLSIFINERKTRMKLVLQFFLFDDGAAFINSLLAGFVFSL